MKIYWSLLALLACAIGAIAITPKSGQIGAAGRRVAAGGATTAFDSAIAYWKMDDASNGNAVDSEPTGTAQTLTDVTSGIASTTGKIGTSRTLEAASTERFTRADSADLSLGADVAFTFHLWIFPNTLTDYQAVFSKCDDADANAREYLLEIGADGSCYFSVGNGTSKGEVQSADTVTVSAWNRIAVWHDPDANQIAIQINNGTPTTLSWTGGTIDTTEAFWVGILTDTTSEAFNGQVDEMGFWKRVLTSQERSDLWNGGSGLASPW